MPMQSLAPIYFEIGHNTKFSCAHMVRATPSWRAHRTGLGSAVHLTDRGEASPDGMKIAHNPLSGIDRSRGVFMRWVR